MPDHTLARHPGTLPDLHPDRIELPFGTDEVGQVVSWHLGAGTPHALIVGPTGSGRATLIRCIAMTAAAAGVEVVALDPRRIEFSGLRGWPGVTHVATRPEDMARAIDRAYAEMMRRTEAINDGTVTVDELRPILLVIDEYLFLAGCLADLWRQTPDARGEPLALGQVRHLADGGRGANIHLCIGTPRRDVLWLGGLEHGQLGLEVRITAPSRCIAYTPAASTETQVWSIPDPRNVSQLSADDQDLLARLRPDPDTLAPAVLGELASNTEPDTPERLTLIADPVVKAMVEHITDTFDESVFGQCPRITINRAEGTVAITRFPGGPGVHIAITNLHPSTVTFNEYDAETDELLREDVGAPAAGRHRSLDQEAINA
jgi:hypothetical protein